MTYRKFPHTPRRTPAWLGYVTAVRVGFLVVIVLALFR